MKSTPKVVEIRTRLVKAFCCSQGQAGLKGETGAPGVSAVVQGPPGPPGPRGPPGASLQQVEEPTRDIDKDTVNVLVQEALRVINFAQL